MLILPLETQRLCLRDFVAEDFAAIYTYASDPEVTKHMFYGPRDEAETREYLQRMLESQQQQPRTTWELGVVERATGRLIGACDLTLDEDGAGDLGYILGREAWGLGYASETARAMVYAGVTQLKLERIYAVCEVGHQASARVLEKAGLRWTRTQARYYEAKGRWWDMELYELRRADWDRTR